MRLEIDLGNTFLKWRLVGQVRLSGGRFKFDELEFWLAEQVDSVTAIWIASVASDAVNHQLSRRLQAHFGVEPEFARVTKQGAMPAFEAVSGTLNSDALSPLSPAITHSIQHATNSKLTPLINAYAQPEKMGVDRWLAMLAAWNRFAAPLIVVDAGSAITIERISADGHYLGGTILAGFQMQQTSLLGQTARVRFDAVQGDALLGGVDTASCVASGAELVLRGVAIQLSELVVRSERTRLVITGGDADHLIGYLDSELEYMYVPELVMDGLALAKKEKV
jgi:type III pantothenate kinase